MKRVCNYKIRVDDGYWKKWWMMSNKCKMQMQGAIGITERVGWGATAKRSRRGRGRDDDGPRRVGSDLLAPACSTPDRLDPRDWPPSFHHQILLAIHTHSLFLSLICSTCSSNHLLVLLSLSSSIVFISCTMFDALEMLFVPMALQFDFQKCHWN